MKLVHFACSAVNSVCYQCELEETELGAIDWTVMVSGKDGGRSSQSNGPAAVACCFVPASHRQSTSYLYSTHIISFTLLERYQGEFLPFAEVVQRQGFGSAVVLLRSLGDRHASKQKDRDAIQLEPRITCPEVYQWTESL